MAEIDVKMMKMGKPMPASTIEKKSSKKRVKKTTKKSK